MNENNNSLMIIGGGLAGCEAAWQAAKRGISVLLYEMRPTVSTKAHTSADLAELVCSNSLGSNLIDRASGVLKEELRLAGSLLVECAEIASVPAGNALAVDRKRFSAEIEKHLLAMPNIKVVREEVKKIPSDRPVIVASGPLSSSSISEDISKICGYNNLFFFDAIAPIVEYSSIDLSIAYSASRYNRDQSDEGDYINCPFNKTEYETFVNALTSAERFPLRDFEEKINDGVTAGKMNFFEGCLPVEVLAGRSVQALAFGPMRPVGLIDPRTGKRPWAVLQLRQDNLSGSLYNLVGFQTNLLQKEQERVFRMIPGLQNAQFVRYGQMHRNTYICSPEILKPTLQMISNPNIYFAGQLCGVEGYMGNIATGLLAGINAARFLKGGSPLTLPEEMISGSLVKYITTADPKHFQPMKANFGILPPLDDSPKSKRERYMMYSKRAIEKASIFFEENK